MELGDYVGMVFEELRQAEIKFPGFPTDPVHAASIMVEEVGELVKAVNEFTYEGGSLENVTKEAVQSAAMALRFLFNMEYIRSRPSDQEERITDYTQQTLPGGEDAVPNGKATSGSI